MDSTTRAMDLPTLGFQSWKTAEEWADYCHRCRILLVPPDPELIIKIPSRATRLGLDWYEYLELLVKADLDRLEKG